MSSLVARVRPTRAELVDAAALLSLSGVSLYAFRSSYGGWEFLIDALAAVVTGVVVAHATRRLRVPFALAAAAGVVVYVLLCSLLALRRLALGGIVPTPASLSVAITKTFRGWKELLTTSPPVGNTGELLAIPVFLGFVCGFVGWYASRRFARLHLAVFVPLVALGLGIATGTTAPVSLVVNGGVAAVVAVAWLAVGARRSGPEQITAPKLQPRRVVSGAVVLGVAGAAGLLAAGHLPMADRNDRAIWRQTVTPPFDPRQYASPLAGYRSYVKAGRPSEDPSVPTRVDAPVMFTVEGLPQGIPVRLATMDAYDGLVWQVSAGAPQDEPSLRDSGSFERIGTTLQPDTPGTTAEVTVTIGDYRDVWIPDVGEVISLRFTGSADGPDRDRALTDSFRYNRSTDTAATPLRLHRGDRYVMTVRLPNVVEDLTNVVLDPDYSPIGQERNVPGVIAERLGTPDVLSLASVNLKLDKVAKLMRQFGTYSDGDDALAQVQSLAGHSNRRLAEFVQDIPKKPMIGNAEQYAAAYALLFRQIAHLPTRVVMGFKPSGASDGAPIEVVATEAEAWVEVPTESLGWIAIEPTPLRSQRSITATSPLQPEPDYRTQNPPAPPLLDPEFDQAATAKGKAKTTTTNPPPVVEPPTGPSPITRIVSSPVFIAGGIVASPFLLTAIFGMVVGAIKARRRRHRRSRGAPHSRIANGWREVTDLATDLGRPVPAASTRREAAAFASERSIELATRADAAVWSGDDLSDNEVEAFWNDLLPVLKAMRSDARFTDRLRATLAIRTLRRSGRVRAGTKGRRNRRERKGSA